MVSKPDFAPLGNILIRRDISSSLGLFQTLPGYIIKYPEVVIKALGNLYDEYNRSFISLVAANREWDTDYRFCTLDGQLVNWIVRIDMVGLDEQTLQEMAVRSVEEVREALRGRIFEFENSPAMYSFLRGAFAGENGESFFSSRFDKALDVLRERFGKQIALLAVTGPKFRAMLKLEFGHQGDGHLKPDAVRQISGFDAFWGVHEARQHFKVYSDCQYLLYARTSDPVEKLINPSCATKHPILGDAGMRRVVKANVLTFNVDAPEWQNSDPRRINDTKEYMPLMGMAFQIASIPDLASEEFRHYLESQGVNPFEAMAGKIMIRCKPAKGAYGCYGHVRGKVTDYDFNANLEKNLSARGPYVVQPELDTPIITNTTDGVRYAYVDRNFFTVADGVPQFLGGFRNLVPFTSPEVQTGRIHGSSSAVYAEIVC